MPAAVGTTPAATGLTETMEWALGRLGEPLDMRRLAARAGLPVRTFARHFRDSAELRRQWVIGQRVLAARHALETGSDSIERIAFNCGFGTAASRYACTSLDRLASPPQRIGADSSRGVCRQTY